MRTMMPFRCTRSSLQDGAAPVRHELCKDRPIGLSCRWAALNAIRKINSQSAAEGRDGATKLMSLSSTCISHQHHWGHLKGKRKESLVPQNPRGGYGLSVSSCSPTPKLGTESMQLRGWCRHVDKYST